jgi:NADH-quinone oxidoreductase subunit H
MDAPLFANWWGHFGLMVIVVIMIPLAGLLMLGWMERRLAGRFQVRVGPNRCGPLGLLQNIADGMKMALKEDIMPDKADKVLHVLAPILVYFPIFMVLAVIPFANERGGLAPDLDVGILYLIAITSFCGIGLLAAGWASSNKYSLFGGMRAIATMVSYEFPVVLSLIGVVLVTGSLSVNAVVQAQEDTAWFIILQPLGFVIFFVGMLGEISRPPFDVLECESEIIAGPSTEYSGLRYGVFMLAEYGEAIVMSCLVTTLFLGGYSMPEPLGSLPLGPLWFVIKAVGVYFVLAWIRVTIPRFRIDQWMGFAWKGLLPLAIFNLAIIAVEVVAFGNGVDFPAWAIFINVPVCILSILLWSKLAKTGTGKTEVRVLRKGQIQGPEGYFSPDYGRLEGGS